MAHALVYDMSAGDRDWMTTYVTQRMSDMLAESLQAYATQQWERIVPPDLC